MQLVPVSILVAATAAITIRSTASAFLAVSPTTTQVSAVSPTIPALNAAEYYVNSWVPADDENASTVAFGLLLPRTTTLDDPVEDVDRNYGVAEQQKTDLQQQQQQQQTVASPIQHQLDELQHPSIVEMLASVIIGATQFGLLVAPWGKNLTMVLVCFIYLQTIL